MTLPTLILALIVSFLCAAIAAEQVDAWMKDWLRRARVRHVEFVADLIELAVCARWRLRCGWSVFDDRGRILIEGEAPDRFVVARDARAVLAELWRERWGEPPRLDVRVRNLDGEMQCEERPCSP